MLARRSSVLADRLTVGGLFSGIGGWELGLERAGMDIAWHCEADPFCRRVLAKHWPGVPCFEDVKTLTAGMAEGVVDVLCGGFPCQDISLAGKGAGISGSRSGLWSEYARLIGEFEPRWVCVENVSALLGRGLSVVLADLSALGYDAEWDCIPASAVGAPHQRDRIWLVAYPQRDKLREQSDRLTGRESARIARNDGPQRVVADAESNGRRQGRSGRLASDGQNGQRLAPEELADAEGERRWPRLRSVRQDQRDAEPGDDGWGCGGPDWWAVEPDVGRVAHGIPARVDRLRSLGNALVPQIAEWIGRRIIAHEHGVSTP